ncbi:vasorin-like [Ostrea edulis]|uniref:vasorin-like n=1 Tax=Ostrea edulis TaxID=37623 RepID=UPI0024AF8FB6|nr:vasorin-like [Ostrea edulis]
MRLVVWVSVVFPVLYSQGTDACPDECYCEQSSYCNGTYIGCGFRGLSRVPTNIPTNTCELGLWNNAITTLENGIFDGLTNLQILGLWNNAITTLENGIFDGLTNLQILDLKYNRITTLQTGSFDELTNLHKLYLYGNKISTLPNGIFDALTNLETL